MASAFEGQSSDIVLFIVGGSRAGKDMFIKYVAGTVPQRCVDSTCTLGHVRLLPTRQSGGLDRVVLVDGPSFEATQGGGLVAAVRKWFSSHYCDRSAPSIRGIILVHDVSLFPPIPSESVIFRNLQATINLAIPLGCYLHVATMKRGRMTDNEPEYIEEGAWKRLVDVGVPLRHIKLEGEKEHDLSVIECFLHLEDAQREENLKTLYSAMAPTTRHVDESALALLPSCGRSEDIVILVMGALKSGKSSFINWFLDFCGQTPSMRVSDGMTLCTSSVESAIIMPDALSCASSRRIVLVDTPGFEGDSLVDLEVLGMIHRWFQERFEERIASCSIIYLHSISHDGFARTASRVLGLFPAVVRNVDLKNGVIVSTKWDRSLHDAYVSRENQLSNEFWGNLISRGYTVRRLSKEQPDIVANHLDVINEVIFMFDYA